MYKKLSTILILLLLLIISCEKEPSSPPETFLKGYVLDATDSSAIDEANVVLYNANTNAPVTRTFTDSDGLYSFEIDPDIYYLKVSAQGYRPSPPKDGTPLSFQVVEDETTWKDVYLDEDISADSCGSISGTIIRTDSITLAGVLIIATDATSGLSFSGTSGPDGYYIVYNVKPGTYSIECFRAGYLQVTKPVIVNVTPNSTNPDNNIVLLFGANATISGHITFLASPNSVVDITLIHPITREAIPGLSTYNDTATNIYQLTAVPPGDYIAWATYRNDGYVMDPDRIQKFGLPFVTIADTTTAKVVDFEVTGAIPIVSPTNPADTILPTLIMTTSPTFTWEKYPSAKEYILEVSNSKGEIVWGGYDSAGVILHSQVGADLTTAVYNFDGSASDSLHIGEVYRWKLYADNDANLDIQGLISSSEDLLGIFKVIADTTNF